MIDDAHFIIFAGYAPTITNQTTAPRASFIFAEPVQVQ